MNLILIAIAPIIILALYVYFRDKYEKEPWWMLLLALGAGAFIVIPILPVEIALSTLTRGMNHYSTAFFDAFIVAASTEEVFKYLAVVLLFFWSKQFNERFDGIVYAVFVSLGFALVENIMYVYFRFGTMEVGYLRAITAVPAHTLFGVAMGYRLGLAKFAKGPKAKHLILALLIPIILHGIYDWLIMVDRGWGLLIFFPFVIFLWVFGLIRMRKHSKGSRFNPKNMGMGGDQPEL